jgi:hypothetical protein
MRSTKHFWENSTRARCFAELFGTHACETIYAVVVVKMWFLTNSSREKLTHLFLIILLIIDCIDY